jgi:choline-sulfatase
MKRRDFLKTTGLGAAGIALNGSLAQASQGDDRPNVLLIMTDQHFADAMSCRMGNQYISTPAMDRLAGDGMLFSRAYCPNPICVPSRTSMFTGRYPHETGVQDNGKYRPDPAKFPTLGTVFQQAGYDTGYVGKWHLPFPSGAGQSGFNYSRNRHNKGYDDETPPLVRDFLKTKRQGPFFAVASFCNPHNICEWARGDRGDDLPDGSVGRLPPPELCPPLATNRLPPDNETDIMRFLRA